MSEAQDARPLVGIVGGGVFGRALVRAASRTGEVVVWSRRAPSFDLPNVRVSTDAAQLVDAELVLLAVPSRYVSLALDTLGHHLDGGHLLVHVSRGLLDDELRTLSAPMRSLTPCRRVGALAGPVSADLLDAGTPGAGVVGSEFPEVVDAVRAAIGGPTLRIYASSDLRGVELAAALTGILLFTIGVAKRVGFGPGTIGALATRGVAEVSRIGEALGAKPETFHGLACFGDLIAAVGGSQRPEMILGDAIAGGASPEEALAQAGGSVEGIEVAHRVAAFCERRGINAPLITAVSALVSGRLDTATAVRKLMGRQLKRE